MEKTIIKCTTREELEKVVRESEVYKANEKRYNETLDKIRKMQNAKESIGRDLIEEREVYRESLNNFQSSKNLHNGNPCTSSMGGNSRITADRIYDNSDNFLGVNYYYDATDYSKMPKEKYFYLGSNPKKHSSIEDLVQYATDNGIDPDSQIIGESGNNQGKVINYIVP